MIKVKMYPAKNGDCFLISIGKENKRHILIDSGYVETYEKFLKRDLIEINAVGEKINLMIISHIDEDHILGALNFIEENNKKNIIQIEEVWFNSYRHLEVDRQAGKLSEQEKNLLKSEISLGKSFVKRITEKGVEHTDISARQGSTLGALLMQGNYKWNYSFKGLAISSNNKLQIELNDISINVISPNDTKLERLKNKWLKELKKKKWNFKISKDKLFDDAYEFMLLMDQESTVEHSEISKGTENDAISIVEAATKEDETLDCSVTNGSSIAVMIEYDKKRLLFLADAHPDIIYESLMGMEISNFDLVKLPHHGSKKNMTLKLAKLLKSEIYLVSTNGDKHLHPDLEAIAKIIYSHSKVPKKFYFNYETLTSKQLNETSLRNQYNYGQIIGSGERAIEIEL
ncbi:MBL fold metallo-hydrolase [Virgibacillus kekensis]|uniref:MBL fold metallo-hydrolase n=1 Tax=Virgibacillus kekensis TaxID=202261 RepID=A0ABV9DF30_9BACI